MGFMTKMRENTKYVLYVLVVAFGLIFMLMDTNVFDVMSQNRATTIGEVNGEAISYEEFNVRVQQYLDFYQLQNGEGAPPQTADSYRDQAFNALIDDKLRQREMDRLGITVSQREVIEMIQGENPDPWIVQNFPDGNGGVDRVALQSVIDDPAQEQLWISVEEYLRNKRREEKLNNLIASSVRISEADVRDDFMRKNRKINANYVALRYNILPDTALTYDNDDLEDFYNEIREEFKQPRTYRVEYVTFSKLPTIADSTLIQEDLERLRSGFETTDNDSVFVASNDSRRPFRPVFFTRGELDQGLADAIYGEGVEVGKIYGPIASGDLMHLVKVTATERDENPTVKARHILIGQQGDNEATKAQNLQTARDVLRRLRQGEDFATLAAEFSQDNSNKNNGGDLGWFSKGRMVAEFEEAAFGARVGRIVGPVETQFGYHLIEVLDRTFTKVQVADVARRIQADISTLTALATQADDFAYFATEESDFATEAAKRDLNPTSVSVNEDMRFIPGLGTSRAMLNFVKLGEVGGISEVMETNDLYVVAHITEIIPEGYRPFDDVRNLVESRAKLAWKKDLQVERMEAALAANGFDGLANAISASVMPLSNMGLDNPVIPGLGREPRFAGTAIALADGQTSEVVAGENAVFVLQVTSSVNPAMTPNDELQIRNDLETRMRNQLTSQWMRAQRDAADVQDYRYRFSQ